MWVGEQFSEGAIIASLPHISINSQSPVWSAETEYIPVSASRRDGPRLMIN
jgi:hypothetical protein